MAIEYYPYDDGDGAVVREDDWRDMARLWRNTGVIENKLNDFEVYADNTGMLVKVMSGWAWIEGHLVKSDAEEEVTIPAADGSNPRKDLIVLRNHFGNNEITLEVIEGTPATSPVAPTVTQNSTQWEIALAVVDVAASETSIENSHVTDQRSFSSGNQGPAEQIEETGGPTTLDIAAIADGENLQRSGTDIVGASPLVDTIQAAEDILVGTGSAAAKRLALGADKKILAALSSVLRYQDLYDLLNIAYDEVATSQSTGSTSYTDLATAGPSVTVNTPNGIALVLWQWMDANATSGVEGYVGVGVDAADPASGLREARSANESTSTPNQTTVGFAWITGLTVANHTFKLRYKTTAGTHFFVDRKILAIGF